MWLLSVLVCWCFGPKAHINIHIMLCRLPSLFVVDEVRLKQDVMHIISVFSIPKIHINISLNKQWNAIQTETTCMHS